MSLHDFIAQVLQFAHDHEEWLFLLIFILTFLESLSIIAFLFPGTILIVALSVIVGEIDYPFWSLWVSGSIGAFLGTWCSYEFGYRHKNEISHIWPFSRKPMLLPKVQKFFHKWGLWAVFFCRFLAPFRATIPMVSGMFAVSKVRYQCVSAISSILWTLLVLSPGAFGIHWLMKWIS
ncbi:DedA family protein [Ignatzschineria sp. LJL83]